MYTERFDLLLGDRPQEVCEPCGYLKDHADQWDVLELRQLPGTSQTLSHLPGLIERDGYRVGRWSAKRRPMWRFNSRGGLLPVLKKAHCSNVRNHTRQLERHGPVTLDIVAIDDRWEDDMEDDTARGSPRESG